MYLSFNLWCFFLKYSYEHQPTSMLLIYKTQNTTKINELLHYYKKIIVDKCLCRNFSLNLIDVCIQIL